MLRCMGKTGNQQSRVARPLSIFLIQYKKIAVCNWLGETQQGTAWKAVIGDCELNTQTIPHVQWHNRNNRKEQPSPSCTRYEYTHYHYRYRCQLVQLLSIPKAVACRTFQTRMSAWVVFRWLHLTWISRLSAVNSQLLMSMYIQECLHIARQLQNINNHCRFVTNYEQVHLSLLGIK